ncbi:MAG: hypothetical protein GF405_06290, partial [Candidatus Eisenbacteria bacterium]|nr:hypothetical protein [Candidatus Eisenbacteria bacterium]
MRSSSLVLAVLGMLILAGTASAIHPTIYGYIKLDASLDSALTNDGNFAYVVLPYVEGEEESAFNMTAKQTRLGMKFVADDESDIDVSGRVEFDFYGGGGENKPNPMLRHAYLEMDFGRVRLLAGQTSDVISPLNPTTLNYIVMWKSGNIGYRRPQIRVSAAMEMGDDAKLILAGSANRNMGDDENGERTGMPSFQGRMAFATRMMGEKPLVVGVSGVYGTEEDEGGCEFDRTGVSIDATVPLGAMAELKGEYFTGRNLAVHLGGVGQGIAYDEPTREDDASEIEASGWWAQLAFHPVETLVINFGAGMDDPELPDYAAADMIEKNTTYYGNAI